MAAKKGDKASTDLGTWIWRKADEKGFTTKLKFIRALDLSQATVYAWADPTKLAVPERSTVELLERTLRLNREEKQELSELVRRQTEERAGAEWLRKPARGSESREIDRADADAPAPVTLLETGRARWELYGAQHVEFMVAAREALAGGVGPLQLDAAADRLGWRYKGASPTYEECEAAIREALKKAKSWEAVTGGGRDGTEDELEPPPRATRRRG